MAKNESKTERPATGPDTRADVLIGGGGFAGLALAVALRQGNEMFLLVGAVCAGTAAVRWLAAVAARRAALRAPSLRPRLRRAITTFAAVGACVGLVAAGAQGAVARNWSSFKNPRVAVGGGRMFVVWTQADSGSIRMARSDDRGHHWHSSTIGSTTSRPSSGEGRCSGWC